jgi:N-acetylmuramoyl-L-alanine amidase
LQALLAFSALHAQLRERRKRSGELPADTWEVEGFVLDDVLQLVAQRALAITGADGIAIALAEGEAIICRGSAGAMAPDAGARLDPKSGFSGACFRSGQVIRCDDASHDSRVNLQAAMQLGARSMVAVPLAVRNNVLGLIAAFSYDAYGFNDSDVRTLNLLAELILAALRPEEEDRLAEIARRVNAAKVAAGAQVEPVAIRDENVQDKKPVPAPSLVSEYAEEETSLPGLRVVVAVILVAVMFGGGVWWKFGHQERAAAEAVQSAARQMAVEEPAASEEASSAEIDAAPVQDPTAVDAPATTPEEAEKLSVLPQVTGVRHWSSAESNTVVIDLEDQVQYEAHKLANPDRIYFDLHDTALAHELLGKTIAIGDPLVSRVRIAQPMAGITRVVLDTKVGSNFSVSLESNPYRLVVEVHKMGAEVQEHKKPELFEPANPGAKIAAVAPQARAVEAKVHPPASFRIALDAGHGGWDLGTVGRQGLLEKDLTLDIVERLGSLIKERLDAQVIYTRKDDNYIALDRRAEIANQAQADLFVSIHANNSALTSARGVETYYTNTFSSVHAYSHEGTPGGKLETVSFANVNIRDKVLESRKVAADLQRALYAALAAKTPGIRDRGVKKASYVVLTGTSMPAVLAEVSFVSSPADETNLQNSTYRQGIADALYKGIERYVDAGKVKMASARVGGR